MKVSWKVGCKKIIGIAGLYEIWGRDYGIEESYLGPSQKGQPTNDWKPGSMTCSTISVDGEEQKETKNIRFKVPVSRNLLKLEKGMV